MAKFKDVMVTYVNMFSWYMWHVFTYSGSAVSFKEWLEIQKVRKQIKLMEKNNE